MQLVDGMKPEQRETMEAMIQPQAVLGELAEAKLLRAIYSDRQLDEVMTDFWFNHFNVFIGKGPDRYMITAYERDVIRPHALGKFKDLLVATAKSPAMLFYLDNWQSVGPNSDLALYGPQRRHARRRGRFAASRVRSRRKNRPSGLNENYAREIMELHTLGVDGGYTQKDVTELAKVLTGWSIEQPQLGGDFKFNERAHEPGAKICPGPQDRRAWRKRRRGDAGHAGASSFDREIYLAQAGHALCFRQSAASPGGPHGGDISEERWRYSRSAAAPCSTRRSSGPPMLIAPR